jgi:replication factor C subunit 3/5
MAEKMDVDQAPAASSSSSAAATDNLPWVEKYRPNSLNEMVSHEEIIQVLNKLIDNSKLPHLLFYGPPGTGKTSAIVACAKKMYGNNYKSMALELNASDDRGIDVVRDQIKEFAGTRKLFSTGIKLVILDEADAMTTDAQSALRRIIEKYTSNTRFCMICNYVNKIMPALQSRCTKFRFAPLKTEQITGKLDEICEAEKIKITPSGKQAILDQAGGDMRRVLNLLQSAHTAYPEIGEEQVYLCAGAAMPKVIDQLFMSLMNDTFDDGYKNVTRATTELGYALVDIATAISIRVLETSLPPQIHAHILDKLSNVEYALSHGVNEKLQIGAVVGAFSVAREMLDTP